MATHVMIMAGGTGVRFWPRSRARRPKQLLDIASPTTMLRETVRRVLPLEPESLTVVTSALQQDATREQLALEEELPAAVGVGERGRLRLLAEPVGRNTAPAVALAAGLIAREDPTGTMIVLAADHHITRVEAFRGLLGEACQAADRGALVTLGIRPTRPETGYGYIELGPEVAPDVHRVARFREKPDRDTAQDYLDSGRFLWNSGMFVWRVDAILGALAQHMPSVARYTKRLMGAPADELEAVIEDMFANVESQSIDYGVMEKHDDVLVLPADIGWSDVGSWASLHELVPRDECENASLGDVVLLDSHGCFVQSTGRTVAAIGVEGLVIVETPDAVMICPRERSQEVRRLVDELARRGRDELL